MAAEPNSPAPAPASRSPAVLAWVIAAVLALAVAWAGRLYVAEREQSSLLRDQARLAELELKAVRNQAEAERILAQRQLADERARSAELERQLRESRAKAGGTP